MYLQRQVYVQDMHENGNQKESWRPLLDIEVFQGSQGAYLVLNTGEWSLHSQDDIDHLYSSLMAIFEECIAMSIRLAREKP
jgi:hypothetical protein